MPSVYFPVSGGAVCLLVGYGSSVTACGRMPLSHIRHARLGTQLCPWLIAVVTVQYLGTASYLHAGGGLPPRCSEKFLILVFASDLARVVRCGAHWISQYFTSRAAPWMVSGRQAVGGPLKVDGGSFFPSVHFKGVPFPTTGVDVISGDCLIPPDVVFPVVAVSFPLPGVGLCHRDVVGPPKVAGLALGSPLVDGIIGFCHVDCTRVLLVCVACACCRCGLLLGFAVWVARVALLML